ncbi:MAG: amino acid adenylation domain-containing protein [Verrucomicrobia bacterium]|nr:amino acid adenylation domain-containing protein [Verrucomicrobiota bacterium]
MNDRKSSLVLQLKSLFGELTGEDLSKTDQGASFFDLGFDSLLLTQVSQSVQSKFGVKVTFRQIMNDLSSLDALAGFLDGKLAPEPAAVAVAVVSAAPAMVSQPAAEPVQPAARPSSPTPPQPMPLALPTPMTAPTLSGDSGPIERVVNQQLQVMAHQLELLRRLASGGELVALPALSAPAQATPLPPAAEPRAKRPVIKAVKGDGEDSKRFGPFKGIETGPKGGLTPRQQKALAELTARYNKRTAGSKRMTQEHRAHFCDPRAAGGFRQLWKEMVYPIMCARSLGARLWDIDGNEYVDVTTGFGANYLGHSPEFVTRAVEEQLKRGVEIGPQSPLAGENAKLVCELTGMERATFCNTGSEAVMAALRVSRTVTGREKFVFFRGDYHGIFDEVLARPASVDGLPGAMPIAPGVPHLANVIVLEYGNPASIETIKAHANEIAAVMVEPVQARHPDLQPREFLHELRRLTEEQGIALIFDEVITGFRVAPGGAQEYFGVRADLATYGKVIGGGMPIGVLAGKAKFMDALDGGPWQYGDDSFPEVGVTFFAGTFVRHPLAMAAANAVLKYLKATGPSLQQAVNERTARFVRELNAFFQERELPMRLQSFSAMFYYDFHPDLHYAGLLFYYLRDRGVHIWEGRVGHLSTAHTDQDMEFVLKAFKESVLEMQEGGFLPGGPGSESPAEPKATDTPSNRITVTSSSAREFPLTEAQTEMWVAAQMRPEASGTQNATNVVHLVGKLDVAALQKAIDAALQRHEALRCTFSPDGTRLLVAPSVSSGLPVHDLSSLAPAEREAQARQILDQEGQRIFDLTKGPLFSFQLIRLAAEEHLFVFTVQMIACDGWSYNLVLEDISAIYSALVEGRQPSLEPAQPMREYVAWQAQANETPEAKECETFWMSQFKTLPPPFELPSFRTRPAARSFDGDRQNLRLSPAVYQEIKRAAKELRNTPFCLLLAAYQTWLYRLSGLDDLVVGVPFAGQSGASQETLVGQCVHTLPLRVKLDAAEPFANFLLKTRESLFDAQEHWNYSFGKLVQRLDLPRDASRIPLVSVIFNLDPPFSKVQFAGCTQRITAGPRFYYQYDLGFNLVDEGSTLLVECDYNRNLFEADTIRRWLGHFQTLLEGIVADPRQPLNRLPLLSETERKQIVVESNNTAREFARAATVHELVSAQAARTPDAVAVECEGQRLTYTEFERRANQLANQLRTLGVGPDVLVGVCAPRSLNMIVGVLGVLKAGGAYVPIDPDCPRDRVAQILEDTGAPVLLTQGGLLSRLPETKARLVCLDEDWGGIVKEETTLAPASTGPANLAYVMYTSGSTGRPKGVEITHGAVVNFLESMRREPGLTAEDVMLALTTLAFDISVLEIFLPLMVGARCVIVSREVLIDPIELSEALVRAGVTVMQATPATWRMLLNAGWKGNPKLKVLCGGEATGPDLAERLLGCCGELWNMYGPTETTVWSSTRQLKKGEPITLGRPIANTQIYVVDDQLQPVPVGLPGELLIGGVGLARGYRNRPELTAEKFIPDPFSGDQTARLYRTGDLARYRPNGEVEFVGRRDFQVKLRGFRIELGEIESVLLSHPQVREAVVTVREDVPGHSRLVGYLVTAADAGQRLASANESDLPAELRSWLRGKLPDYMLPSAFVLLDTLPRTQEGKMDRRSLPAPPVECLEASNGYFAPRNPTEETLARIWGETLKLEKVGIRDSFFDLGGQSLLAVSLFARIEREFGQKLPLATLFRSPTIEQLAAALNNGAADSLQWASLVPIQPKGTKPPLFLVHGAGGNVLLYRWLAQHLAPDYPLYGLQSRGLDGKSTPLVTIEQMAVEYLREMRAVQPKGPYYLGGYCLGGTVAYEMAQILHREGEEVPLVAMLDTYNFSRALKASFATFLLQKLRFHFGNFVRLRPAQMIKYIVEKVRVARDGELANLLTSMPGSTTQAGVARAESGIEASVQAINDHAADTYLPKPYAGRLTLFKPHVNYKFYPDPNMGWSDLALGGLDIVELRLNPHAMLVEPYVRQLAAELKTRLEGQQPEQVRSFREATLPETESELVLSH